MHATLHVCLFLILISIKVLLKLKVICTLSLLFLTISGFNLGYCQILAYHRNTQSYAAWQTSYCIWNVILMLLFKIYVTPITFDNNNNINNNIFFLVILSLGYFSVRRSMISTTSSSKESAPSTDNNFYLLRKLDPDDHSVRSLQGAILPKTVKAKSSKSSVSTKSSTSAYYIYCMRNKTNIYFNLFWIYFNFVEREP